MHSTETRNQQQHNIHHNIHQISPKSREHVDPCITKQFAWTAPPSFSNGESESEQLETSLPSCFYRQSDIISASQLCSLCTSHFGIRIQPSEFEQLEKSFIEVLKLENLLNLIPDNLFKTYFDPEFVKH